MRLRSLFFSTLLATIAAGILLFLPSICMADAIPIVNPSFESPSAGTFIIGLATGWIVTGNAGVLSDYCPSCFPPPVDGLQEAFINGVGSIDQVLTTSLAANTTYTLTVYVGQRTDVPGLTASSYDVQLLAGGVLLAQNGSVLPASHTFSPVIVTFTTGSSGPQIGQALEIDLVSNNNNSFEVWDSVSLDGTSTSSVPEPGSLILLGTGLLGLGPFIRRRFIRQIS